MSRWTTLDPARALAHLREVAGLSQAQAGERLRLPIYGWTCTALAGREQRNTVQARELPEYAAAYGLEVEIRVRHKTGANEQD